MSCPAGAALGFPNICDNAEIGELIACGCHIISLHNRLRMRGRIGILPVIEARANRATYRTLASVMDVDPGRILGGARASGVHPDLEKLRAGRPGVFARQRGTRYCGVSHRGERFHAEPID
jgi:hypothetical protein